MTLYESIHQWMQGREDEFQAALAPLIAIPSVTGQPLPGMPFGEEPARALQCALELAEAWGLSTGTDEGYVGTADINDQPDGLHILAHLDVVGAGENWNTDPFTLVRDGDIIYGRGTDDDKGPAVAAMLAMRCVKELGIPLTKNARLILGTDEETGSRDIQHYYASHPFAPNAVTPDAEFPVTNVEKAGYAPTICAAWEPSSAKEGWQLRKVSGGIRINVVPGNCTAWIAGADAQSAAELMARQSPLTGVKFEVQPEQDGIRITAQGKQGHAAEPEKGNNAITAMLDLLAAMPLAQGPAAEAVHQLAVLFPHGDHWGTALGISQEDEVSGKLTLTLSLLELDETGFRARFDCRAPICATEASTRQITEAAAQQRGWQCTGSFRPGHYVDGQSDFIQKLLTAYEAFTGKKGYCESTGGGTYVHNIPGGVAFGAGEHGFQSNLHGANERASLTNLLRCAEIYAAAIALCCGE